MLTVWTSISFSKTTGEIDYHVLIQREGQELFRSNCPCGVAEESLRHTAANRAVREGLEWIALNVGTTEDIQVYTSDFAVAKVWRRAGTRFRSIRFEAVGNGKNLSRQMGLKVREPLEPRKKKINVFKVGPLVHDKLRATKINEKALKRAAFERRRGG